MFKGVPKLRIIHFRKKIFLCTKLFDFLEFWFKLFKMFVKYLLAKIIMKKILLILIACFLVSSSPWLLSEKNIEDESKASGAYRRLMESAHPTPQKHIKEFPYKVPLLKEHQNPLFMNSMMTVDESGTYRMQNESSIAVNPIYPNYLISSAVDYRDNSSTWIYISKDGGKSWENRNLGKPFPDWRSTNDPSVAFDMDGVGYMVYGGFGKNNEEIPMISGENGVFLARSKDFGETWLPHIPIILHTGEQGLDSTFEDKYYISIDYSPESPYYNHLYVPWKRVTPRDSATQIVISKSTDKGDTWSIPVNVSNRVPGSSEDTTFGQSFPLAASGPDGTLFVVWNHGIEHGVGFARSDDGGETFTEPRIIHHYNIFGTTTYIEGQGWRHAVKGKVRAEAYPVIVTDVTGGERNGYIYVCWAADSVPNVYFSRSTDKGDTWSEPVIVHSDITNDQFWSWISIDPLNGDLAIMYLDSRDDPENILVDCYVSYSNDGGLTWKDRRASDVNSDLRDNPFSGNAFAGDYSGCAFYDGVIYPSWVDMRNAKNSIYDSDVYTAVMSTSSPQPARDFAAEIFPAERNKAKLTWLTPTERVFGQPLSMDEFYYTLFREGEFLTEIGSSETSFIENDLTPHEEYHYDIYVVAGDDSSNVAKTVAYPGGSRQPAAPTIVNAKGNENNDIYLTVYIPATREDGITPFVNLSQVGIYIDGVLSESRDVPLSAAGTEIELILDDNERGYYHIALSVFDDADPNNESDISNDTTIYTGTFEYSYEDTFETASLRKYLNSGQWGVTADFFHSEPFSMTESPKGEYIKQTDYSLRIFPVLLDKNRQTALSFWHACIVDKSDKAIVQYSLDLGESWINLAEYDERDYTPWSDGILNDQDWKKESFIIEEAINDIDTLLVRFLLKTNFIAENDGWYVDDIVIDQLSSVEEYQSQEILLYPNPASEVINIECRAEELNYIEVYDIFGQKQTITEGNITISKSNIEINIGYLDQGTYFVKINSSAGGSELLKFNIIR